MTRDKGEFYGCESHNIRRSSWLDWPKKLNVGLKKLLRNCPVFETELREYASVYKEVFTMWLKASNSHRRRVRLGFGEVCSKEQFKIYDSGWLGSRHARQIVTENWSSSHILCHQTGRGSPDLPEEAGTDQQAS